MNTMFRRPGRTRLRNDCVSNVYCHRTGGHTNSCSWRINWRYGGICIIFSYIRSTGALKEAQLAHEERIEIENICAEHVKMIREYRQQMNEIIENYLSDAMEIFNDSFGGIKDALDIGDVDLLIENANNITDYLGGNKPFETMDEFNDKMLSGDTFKI